MDSKELKIRVLKAYQKGEIKKDEARQLIDSGFNIPIHFWASDDEGEKRMMQVFCSILGINQIEWVDTSTTIDEDEIKRIIEKFENEI